MITIETIMVETTWCVIDEFGQLHGHFGFEKDADNEFDRLTSLGVSSKKYSRRQILEENTD